MLLVDLLAAVLGLVGTDEERYVSDTGEDVYPGTEGEPLRTIGAALAVASTLTAGRRLVIKLQGGATFTESLVVPSNVTIEGPGTILAKDPGPAVRVEGTAAAKRRGVILRDLQLQGKGMPVRGGAVAVEHADDLRMEDCVLRDSRAGRGGGISILSSTAVLLERCELRDNRAGDTPIDIDAIWPTFSFPIGDGHGGGAFVRDSDVRFEECAVTHNRAIYAGGGIAVAHEARPESAVEIVDCEITRNQVSHQPLTALGATWTAIAPSAADDMGDPIRELFRGSSPFDSDQLALLANSHGMGFESGLGGGIALRNTREGTVIRGCHIGITRAGAAAPNVARRGGGVHLYLGAYPAIEDCTIAYNAAAGDGGGIGADHFDPLIPGGGTRNGISAIAIFPRRTVPLARNAIKFNQAVEDGGGLYMTGNARPLITGGVFSENRAGEHGGAIRATYATLLRAVGVRFELNRANVFTTNAGGDSEGGGAVSARNSDLHLEECEFFSNRVLDFAGGAIYYRSSFEGAVGSTGLIADEHGMFDEIQETAFAYGARTLRLVNCRGEDNRAFGPRGAGGFLYALRSPDIVGSKIHGGQEPMRVSIEGERTEIKPCTSEHDRGGSVGRRKRAAVAIELSGTATAGVPNDRVSLARELKAAAIAPSTPTLDARAIVLMPDADQAHDIRHPAFAGGPLVHGPTPALTSLDKTVVPAAGGAVVRATGTGFEAGMRVHLDGAAATVGTVTATTLDFTVPASAPATVDVVVSLDSGAQGWLTDGLKLVATPEVTYMSKLKGRAGDVIATRGKGLPIGTAIDFLFSGTEVAAAVTQTVDDELAFTVPAAPGGATSALVRATSPTGQTFTRPAAKAFEYLP